MIVVFSSYFLLPFINRSDLQLLQLFPIQNNLLERSTRYYKCWVKVGPVCPSQPKFTTTNSTNSKLYWKGFRQAWRKSTAIPNKMHNGWKRQLISSNLSKQKLKSGRTSSRSEICAWTTNHKTIHSTFWKNLTISIVSCRNWPKKRNKRLWFWTRGRRAPDRHHTP